MGGRTYLADDAADELVGHGHLVRLLVGGGRVASLVGSAQLRPGQRRQRCGTTKRLYHELLRQLQPHYYIQKTIRFAHHMFIFEHVLGID